jgi:ubiquinone biosynthesis protein
MAVVHGRAVSLSLFLRSLRIAWALGTIPLRYLGRELTAETLPTVQDRERWWGELLARALESLGATFVKLGQILGSRPDLLPPGILAAMARLQDDVLPLPFETVDRVLRDAWGARRDEIEVTREPMAAASVAQVHEGVLASGERVAIKIQRPEARAQIERDLVLMRLGAQWLDLVPSLHLLSLPGAIERFGTALHDQLDFRKEAANNRRLAHNFRREKKVRVPALHDALSSDRVLTMELARGIKATDPEAVGIGLDDEARRLARADLAARGGCAILKMVFEDGFVHADLHPGNILLADDGTMTFLDLGMVAEIAPDLMRPWVDTFSALAERNGARAAELFYTYAPFAEVEDYEAYERDVSEYLQQLYGARLSEVEISVVVSGMMNVLRRHRVQVDPVFTVVNVALLVAEGLGKQLDPHVDLVLLAVPYLLAAQLTAGAGRAPNRPVPPRGAPV